MCAKGMVGGAILAKAIFATLSAAQRRRALAVWLVRRGSPQDFHCAPALSGGRRSQWGSAVATCTAKSFGDAIENHTQKKSHTVEILCQEAKAEKHGFAGSVIENRHLMILEVACERHAAGQNVIVYLHTAHVHGRSWRLSIHVKCLPQGVNMHVGTFVKAEGS